MFTLLSGNMGNIWNEVKLDVDHAFVEKFTLEVVKGKGFQGDISFDNIMAKTGTCNQGNYICKRVSHNSSS